MHTSLPTGLIQGHVGSFTAGGGRSFRAGRHAKHPAQEVYQELVPFLRRWFARLLRSEAMSGQFSSSKGDFRQSYQQVMNAIDAIVAVS